MLAARTQRSGAPEMDSSESTEMDSKGSESTQAAILVAVRVRPFSAEEQAQLAKPEGQQFGPTARNLASYTEPAAEPTKGGTIRRVVHAIDDHVVVFDPPDDSGAARSTVGASNKRARDVRFVFDRVYGEDATQRDVYEGTTRGLLDAVLGGYNATVFAYGATGCGKTYTISGGGGEAGVVGLAMQELYARIGASDAADVDVAVSYLEVYNETIRDLLAADTGRALALREDARQGVTVAGLSEHAPRGVDAVLALMARGNANRTMSATAANAVSSRSHAVLQVRVRQRARGGGLRTAETQATLSIIDLAGSERAAVARGSGARMREGANINRSLLALANCINALCAPTPRHVPYRDSKLTRLLKFSLGGNCRTVMITCVSPASTFFEETHSTLKYASRAKRIRTTVARNTKSAAAHVAQYQAIIRAQKAEIQRLTRIVEEGRAGPVRAVVAPHKPHDDHDALRRRRAVVAAQNKLSAAYAPVLAARCDHASARVVGQWYAHHAAALRAWRAQFETAVHAPSSDSSSEPDPSSDEFRRQADDLLRDLARARATATRAAEHAAQAVERRLFEAARAAQLPPAARLSKEDAQAVAREHLVLDLSASARGLARHADLADLVAADLAAQNALLLRLSAACLASLKRAQRAVPAEPARLLDSVYLQAIASFSDVTAAMRASMLRVQAAGGPANLPVPEPKPIQSPYVSRVGAAPLASLAAEPSADPPRNPSAAAISAAVAGTTRARRTASANASASASASANASANANANASASANANVQPAPSRSAAVRFAGAAAADSTRARAVARAHAAPATARARHPQPPRSVVSRAAPLQPAQPAQKPADPNPQKPLDPHPQKPLVSPSVSAASVSPVSSVASWASAESSPHHEPLPPAARPLRGILKQSRANGRSPEDSAQITGPVRLGSARRVSRQARMQSNPTSRGPATPTKPTASSRELFKSVGSTQPVKKPGWR